MLIELARKPQVPAKPRREAATACIHESRARHGAVPSSGAGRRGCDRFPGRDAARSSCGALLRRTGIVINAAFCTALQRTASQELRCARERRSNH
jgi:hypothetical protein